jgi:polysaccharide biosynthesis/export protein
MRKIPLAMVFLLGALALGPAILKAQESAAPAAGQPETNDDYVIGVEDMMSITVWKEPDFSVKEMAVRTDGKITMPLINDIQAAGLTTRELRQTITKKLESYISTPTVTVAILKSLSRSVSVVGQVNKPGFYMMNVPITVIELIARAGGITEFAKQKDIKVVREENGKILQYSFNYKDSIRGKNLEQNITLKVGDVVLVP